MTTTPLLTYHGKPDFKAAFLVEIGKHEIADQITKGTYGKMNGQWHGCAIGCSLRSLNILKGEQDIAVRTDVHDRVPAELGWPLWLAYAEDNIFENLPDDLATTWPRRLAEAVPVGVVVPDLVLAKLLRWMLIDDRFGCVHAAATESTKDVVRRMGALFDRTVAGEVVPESEWDEAARAARAAWDAWDARAARAAWDARAARAAWDAWDAWAARAAWDARAARAAWASSAASAAWAAWDASAAWAAWAARAASAAWAASAASAAFYPALSEEVLRLLRELETPA